MGLTKTVLDVRQGSTNNGSEFLNRRRSGVAKGRWLGGADEDSTRRTARQHQQRQRVSDSTSERRG
ncbi:MAG: hypothetical protein ACKO65_09645, partial [Betaproteobacteria bacterium]